MPNPTEAQPQPRKTLDEQADERVRAIGAVGIIRALMYAAQSADATTADKYGALLDANRFLKLQEQPRKTREEIAREAWAEIHEVAKNTGNDSILFEFDNGYNIILRALESCESEEVAELRAWKESMMQIEATWDEQKVGHLLGMKIGSAIRPQILPAIADLRAKLEAARDLISRCLNFDVENPRLVMGRPTARLVAIRQDLQDFLDGTASQPPQKDEAA